MIPRKIHYCWFSGDPYPSLVQECIDSWHKNMPDWEYVLWDYDRVKDIDSIWLQECLQERKWAFAADFIRLWAVFHEGGIYLDSDVMVFQAFEPFLKSSMFIGRESVHYCTFDEGVQVFLTSHCFGSEAGHPYISLNLSYYEGRHFIRTLSPSLPPHLRYDMLMMPYIQSSIAERFGYDPSLSADNFQKLDNGIDIYPGHFFGAPQQSRLSSENFAKHIGQGSWRSDGFNEKRSGQYYSLRYKLHWRVIRVLNFILQKIGYCLFKIKIDGYE